MALSTATDPILRQSALKAFHDMSAEEVSRWIAYYEARQRLTDSRNVCDDLSEVIRSLKQTLNYR